MGTSSQTEIHKMSINTLLWYTRNNTYTQQKMKLTLLNTAYFFTNRDTQNEYQHTLSNECPPRHHAGTYTENTSTHKYRHIPFCCYPCCVRAGKLIKIESVL